MIQTLTLLKNIKFYILTFIILESIFLVSIIDNQNRKEDGYKDELISNLKSQYNAKIDKYTLLSKLSFKELSKKSEVLNIIDKANSSNKSQKEILREKLFLYLKDYYKELEVFGFNLIHFHLKSKESFLRFYDKDKLYNSSINSRYSIELIDKMKKDITGYEVCRVTNGVRYIYPLFLNNNFIGSVEFNLPMDNILKSIKEIFPADYQFIIKKDLLTEKLSENKLKDYKKSDISSDFIYPESILNYLFDKKHKNHIDLKIIKELNLKLKDKLTKLLNSQEEFSIIEKINQNYYTITAIPIFDFENENIAYILSYQLSSTQKFDTIAFFRTTLTVTFFIIILLIFIYKISEKNKSLRNSKLNLEKITDNVSDGLIVVNEYKKITFANKSASRISGYSEDELLNLSIDNLIIEVPKEEKCNYCKYYYSCFIENKRSDVLIDEKCLITKSKSFLPIETTLSTFFKINQDNCTIVSFKDISERKKFINELKKQNDALMIARNRALESVKARDSFIANISHELRTPLNSIINFTDIFIEDYEEVMRDESIQKEYKDYLDRIFKNSKYLLSLIDDILEFSKADANKIKYDIVDIDITPILKSIYANSQNLSTKAIEFKLNLPNEPLKARVDEKRFMQIILNLISNALKFTEKGFIEIRAFKKDNNIVVEIEDSGRGIPKEKQKVIFNPFEQVNSFDKGTGLGLGLVKKMCEGMKIDVSFESIEERGTIFKLILKS